MKERPILMAEDPVRNILAGRQTQDRRPLKPQPVWEGERGIASAGWAWYGKHSKLYKWPDRQRFSEALGCAVAAKRAGLW